MAPKKELQLAYSIAIVLFIVGVFSYAAFSAKPPDQPVRLMYTVVAGNVLFDHKTHVVETGYGLACADCHHHPADDEAAFRACGDCHNLPPEGPKYTEACLECHDTSDIEETEMVSRATAFHDQCIGCHQEYGAGAIECSACHLL